jgi:transcriptional regulator with XRE-family HTH domain
MNHVGKMVRAAARSRGFTLKELSRRLGVSQSTVENYVTRSSLDVEVLYRISIILEVNLIDEFLKNSGDTGFPVVTCELREAYAEVRKVQHELNALACENLLLKTEIGRLKSAQPMNLDNSAGDTLTNLNTNRALLNYG